MILTFESLLSIESDKSIVVGDDNELIIRIEVYDSNSYIIIG